MEAAGRLRGDAAMPFVLHVIAPLKYYVANQPKHGDRHVYGARSRFLTKAVMARLNVMKSRLGGPLLIQPEDLRGELVKRYAAYASKDRAWQRRSASVMTGTSSARTVVSRT